MPIRLPLDGRPDLLQRGEHFPLFVSHGRLPSVPLDFGPEPTFPRH